MKLSSETIRKMMNAVKSTRDQEIDCGHCHDELDQFIDMKISGKNAPKPCRLSRNTWIAALPVMKNMKYCWKPLRRCLNRELIPVVSHQS
ncbi:MAG: hypothetical protein P8Y37_08835 [Anaerolineales bacterium]